MMDRQIETGRATLCGRGNAALTSLWSRLSASVTRLCGRSPRLPPRAPVGFRAPRSSFLRAGAIFCAALALSGCSLSSPKPETRVVAVPSSKPYRYIKPHPTEDKLTENTLAQIERHNNVHWQVKEAEKKAAEPK